MGVFFVITIAAVLLIGTTCTDKSKQSKYPNVYCIMVTGKDSCRVPYARLSVKNFSSQTYRNKYLVIVNHGKEVVLEHTTPFCKEVMVEKEANNLSLGDLRNIAMEMVPYDAAWFPWDDDDYRHPTLIQSLADEMVRSNADMVSLTTRLEYNTNTQFAWRMTIRDGMVIVLAKRDPRFQYIRKDTMEDINLIQRYKELGNNVVTVQNNPRLYLRLVHGNNTSLYINPNKANVLRGKNPDSRYLEELCTDTEKNAIDNIMLQYYKGVISSCKQKMIV